MSAAGEDDETASDGPFRFIADDYGAMVDFFEDFASIFDIPSIVLAAESVLDLPTEDRFTRSVDILKRLYRIDPTIPPEQSDSTNFDDGIRRFFERFGGDSMVSSMLRPLNRQLNVLQRQLLDRVLATRSRTEEHLVAIVLIGRFRDAFHNAVKARHYDWSSSERLSPWVVVFSWFVLIVAKECTEVTEELCRDLVRADHYLRRLEGNDPDFDPEEFTREGVIGRIRLEGAVHVYDRQTVSVSRGAELAGITHREFENVLVRHGIGPRYGPDTVDELLDGPGFSKSE